MNLHGSKLKVDKIKQFLKQILQVSNGVILDPGPIIFILLEGPVENPQLVEFVVSPSLSLPPS